MERTQSWKRNDCHRIGTGIRYSSRIWAAAWCKWIWRICELRVTQATDIKRSLLDRGYWWAGRVDDLADPRWAGLNVGMSDTPGWNCLPRPRAAFPHELDALRPNGCDAEVQQWIRVVLELKENDFTVLDVECGAIVIGRRGLPPSKLRSSRRREASLKRGNWLILVFWVV